MCGKPPEYLLSMILTLLLGTIHGGLGLGVGDFPWDVRLAMFDSEIPDGCVFSRVVYLPMDGEIVAKKMKAPWDSVYDPIFRQTLTKNDGYQKLPIG